MERSRETRRGTASVSGSFPSSRRRSRGSVFRESSGACEVEDGGNDSVRDRSTIKKDRRSRRRRLSSNESFHVDRDETGDGSSDESLDEEHEDEDEPVRGGGSSSSSLRRTGRGKPDWKGSDEVIGVSVPRKARSASAKRFQDSFSAVRQSSSSSPAPTNATSVSPPSSNASMKASRRVKPVTTKIRPPKPSKVSISESEVEVAQFLYGLTQLQSHSSPAKPEIVQSSSSKLAFKKNLSIEGSVSVASIVSSPVPTPISPPSSSQPIVLPQHSSSTHAPTVMPPKRKKPRAVQMEDGGTPAIMMACSSKPSGSTLAGTSISSVAANPATKVEADKEHQDSKAEIITPNTDSIVEPDNSGSPKAETSLPVSLSPEASIPNDILQPEEKPSSSSPVDTKSLMSTEMGLHSTITPNTEVNRAIDAKSQPSRGKNHQIIQKELSSSSPDLPTLTTADVKLEALKMSSPVSAAAEGVKGTKFEIDLMAPPDNCYPDDCVADASDRSTPQASDHGRSQGIDVIAIKSKGITNLSEKKDTQEVTVKQVCSILDAEVKVQTKKALEAVILEKQNVDDKKTESCCDENTLDKGGYKHHSQKIPKNTARQTERTVPSIGNMTSTSTPIPVPIPGWPGGLPPFGYLGSSPANLSGVPSLQGAKPVEVNSSIPNAPFIMLPHPRPNRCATHLFITHLIHYQQQLEILNPFWHAAGSAALYGARPYNMNILPPSDALLLGSSVIRNPNLPAISNLGSGSLVTPNSHNSKKAPNSVAVVQRKQPILPQSAHQGAALMFPFTQPRTGETKSSSVADNSGLLSAPAAAAAAVSASMNTKFSNIAATSDPQYLTMLQGNYPFPIPPSYRAHMNPQQQTAAPFFGGSFYPSHLMQLQSNSLPQTQIPTTSTGCSSSQKHLQAQKCVPTSKPMPESIRPEPEAIGNSEDTQKKLPTHNLSRNPTLHANYSPGFPIMATTLGGKQQPPSDPGLQMGLKAIEVGRPVPPGHAMLQSMPDVRHNHYQLGPHLQIQTTSLSKAPAKSVAKGSDKSPESIHPQSAAAAVQQLQKQAMAQSKPSVPALSTAAASGGMAFSDRIPMIYSNVGLNFPAGSMGFPIMQSPPQWKMPSSHRAAQAGPSGNAIVHLAAADAVVATPSAESSSGKVTKLLSSPVNRSRKPIHKGSPVLGQSAQAQTLGKTQQPFSSNTEPVHRASTIALSQKRHGEPNLATQPMCPGSLNMRRPTNQQTQQGSPVLTAAGASSYLVGGGKGPAVYSTSGGSSVAVTAGASYVKSAANLPVKSAEQKPATA